MRPVAPVQLARIDRVLLSLASGLVPCTERKEWCRSWRAELWHARDKAQQSHLRPALNALSTGLVRDALWLRLDSWTCLVRGTALLCLVSLLVGCLATSFFAFILDGGWRSLTLHLQDEYKPSLVAAPLVLFVAFSVAPRRSVQIGMKGHAASTARQVMFFLAKALLLLGMAFFFSVDCCAPLALSCPNAAEFCQVLLFVLLATIQLRWAFQDQGARCRECLRLLAAPTRVGRPSHNLLEWNGVQIACEQGHGRLSVPELETSWRVSSEWLREG